MISLVPFSKYIVTFLRFILLLWGLGDDFWEEVLGKLMVSKVYLD
jgi:hypothetical protein